MGLSQHCPQPPSFEVWTAVFLENNLEDLDGSWIVEVGERRAQILHLLIWSTGANRWMSSRQLTSDRVVDGLSSFLNSQTKIVHLRAEKMTAMVVHQRHFKVSLGVECFGFAELCLDSKRIVDEASMHKMNRAKPWRNLCPLSKQHQHLLAHFYDLPMPKSTLILKPAYFYHRVAAIAPNWFGRISEAP